MERRAHRLLPARPYASLEEYASDGGGLALAQARAAEPTALIDELRASGLRGRGGGGFPTGDKWGTVAAFASDVLATSVVVNAAEGEPGTYKDRVLLTATPYAVLEGALIGARAVGANDVTFAIKASFADARARLRTTIDEARAAGWFDAPEGAIAVTIVDGPDRYLFGEETALLEVLDGRPPLPRVAPPYRHGRVEVVTEAPPRDDGAGAADVVMAGPGGREAPPTLVNNVETLANVPAIVSHGAAWFRELGTEESPGTILATLTGDVHDPGVYEIPLGTPLTELVELAGGPIRGTRLAGVLGGVSSGFLADLTTAVSYEAMAAAGSGLGSASFHLVGDHVDPLALAAGVSRFLAVESCAQCTPCKLDGLDLARALRRLCANEGTDEDVDIVAARLATVADGARCALARQHQEVVGSLLRCFPDAVDRHRRAEAPPTEPALIGPTESIDDNGERVDASIVDADPAWSGLQTGPENSEP